MEGLSQENLLTNSEYETLLEECKNDLNPTMYNQYNNEQSILPDVNLPPSMLGNEALTTVQEVALPALSPTGTIPSRDYYPGPFKFEVLLDSSTSGKKSWVYSVMLNKVFLDISKSLLVQFKTERYVAGLRVRALPVYSMADHVTEPVERCRVHSMYDDPYIEAHPADNPRLCNCIEYKLARHLILSSHSQAMYDYDHESNRHSILIPLDCPPAGSDTTTIEYQFTCKTSCGRGMNRRPIEVVFTLESENCEVIGRQALGVKICSCPKRDKEKEEEDSKQNNKSCPPGKRKMSTENGNGRLKKIKSENIDTSPHMQNETIQNGLNLETMTKNELLDKISVLNYQITEQNEKLEAKILQIIAEQNEKLEAKILQIIAEQNEKLEAKILQNTAEQNKKFEEKTSRLEAKLDAIYSLFTNPNVKTF